jgi:osmoprotectant transport system substrate-binding protein
MATPAPPPPVDPAPADAGPPEDATVAPGPTGGGTNWLPWIILGAVVILLAVFLFRPGGPLNPDASPEPTTSAAPSEEPSATVEPTQEVSEEPREEPAEEPSEPAGSIASQFTLGGPPECPERPFCLIGFSDVYGLDFAGFVPLDAGGPITVEALNSGQVQVGVLFTSDPAIAVNDFVLLEDDMQLQLADNIVPVIRQEALDANPGIADALNAVMAALGQEELTELNRAVTVDLTPTADVATAWITENSLAGSGGLSGTVRVGSTNFYEQEILGEIFAQTLESYGLTVERRFQLGPREIVFPALQAGEIDILAEYAASALEYVNEGAGTATTDPTETTELLRTSLQAIGLTALDHAEATDQNGLVVTRAVADQYGLTTISDLAGPVR